MKELSIEEKAKRYDERLEKAREEYENHKSFKGYCGKLVRIFPELKESEDERIRKSLLGYLYTLPNHFSHNGGLVTDWIAWLEKKKVLTTEEDLQGKENVLWCIKQAKKYAKDENEMGTCWFAENWLEKQCEQKPTTEMKSAEESLGVNSDTYNKIVDECIYGEQKPAKGAKGNEREIPFSEQEWSEEDEICLQNSLIAVKDKYPNGSKTIVPWLKSLKDRVQHKKEWSEEDKEMLNLIIDIFEVNHPNGYFKANELNDPNMRAVYTEEIVAWLKSLRPQKQWKPSDEQMEALLKLEEMHVLEHEKNQENAHLYMVIKSLREQLLKLMEE